MARVGHGMRRLSIVALVPVLVLLQPGAARPAAPPAPTRAAAGYHHLGATTVDRHTGVLGRLTVTDPTVRAGTSDFVATRFLGKRDGGGETHWLEAGWVEAGWSGGGRQRIYTFDSVRDSWTFYDQFPLHPGDQVWIYLEADGQARAWLWWSGAWNLLATIPLPAAGGAQIEQYVEVYVDPASSGSIAVPRVRVDNVQLYDAGFARYWREGDAATTAGSSSDIYCLVWELRFDTWSAGDCAP